MPFPLSNDLLQVVLYKSGLSLSGEGATVRKPTMRAQNPMEHTRLNTQDVEPAIGGQGVNNVCVLTEVGVMNVYMYSHVH